MLVDVVVLRKLSREQRNLAQRLAESPRSDPARRSLPAWRTRSACWPSRAGPGRSRRSGWSRTPKPLTNPEQARLPSPSVPRRRPRAGMSSRSMGRRERCRRCPSSERRPAGPRRDHRHRDSRRLGRSLARLPRACLDRRRADSQRPSWDPGRPRTRARGHRRGPRSGVRHRRPRPRACASSCYSSSPTPARRAAHSSTSAPVGSAGHRAAKLVRAGERMRQRAGGARGGA